MHKQGEIRKYTSLLFFGKKKHRKNKPEDKEMTYLQKVRENQTEVIEKAVILLCINLYKMDNIMQGLWGQRTNSSNLKDNTLIIYFYSREKKNFKCILISFYLI